MKPGVTIGYFALRSRAFENREERMSREELWLERSVFLKNYENFFLKIFLFLLKWPFQGTRSCFEILLICVITVIKVRDLLLTLLQVITILAYISAHLLFCTYLLIS